MSLLAVLLLASATCFHDAKLHVQFETHCVTEENLPQYIADVKASKADAVQIALVLVTDRGEERQKKFEWCGKLLKTFGDLGYPTAVWTSSMGYGSYKPSKSEVEWLGKAQRLIALNGKSHGSAYCPLDPVLIDCMEQYLRDVIKAGAKTILYDDDWIQTARGHICCLCPRHLALVEKRLGRKVTIAEIRESFTGGPNAVRTAFLDANGEASMSLARRMRALADSIDKSITMGVCATYTLYDFEGLEIDDLLQTLAGEGHRKLLRVSGATYWRRRYDQRYPGEDLDGILELVRMQGGWMRGKNTAVLDENDPYPRRVALVPAWATELYDKAIIADGNVVRNKYILRFDSKRSEPGYFNAHMENLADDEILKDIFAGTESYGIRCVFPQHSLREAVLPEEFAGEQELLTRSSHPLAAHFLAMNGFPVKHYGEGVAIAFGQAATTIDEATMRKGVIIDLPAAKFLEAKGIDTGVRAHTEMPRQFFMHKDRDGRKFAVLPFDGCKRSYYSYWPRSDLSSLNRAMEFFGEKDICHVESPRNIYQVFAVDPRDGSISVLIESLYNEQLPVKIVTRGQPKILKTLRGEFSVTDGGIELKSLPPHGYAAVKFLR